MLAECRALEEGPSTNHAPAWFKTPLLGPAKGPSMRQVGCNGMVCYCNDDDFCNWKDGMEAGMQDTGGSPRIGQTSFFSLASLLLAIACH